jgi:hypothetical protein
LGKYSLDFGESSLKCIARGTEDYLCMGDWCAPWLRYGGKWIDWDFGMKIRVEMRFRRKNSLFGHAHFKKQKKTQVWAFGTGLEPIWPFQKVG